MTLQAKSAERGRTLLRHSLWHLHLAHSTETRYTYIQIHKTKDTQIHTTANIQIHKTHNHKYKNLQMGRLLRHSLWHLHLAHGTETRYVYTQIHKTANTQIHKYTYAQIHKYTKCTKGVSSKVFMTPSSGTWHWNLIHWLGCQNIQYFNMFQHSYVYSDIQKCPRLS